MTSTQRSVTGAIMALALVPFILGLMACLPVPIGNPERSRLDEDLTGIWADPDGDLVVTLFEPFDKRTWLVTTVKIGLDPEHEETCEPETEPASYDDAIAWLRSDRACFVAEWASIYKAWRSKQGGQWFLTMQAMSKINDEENNSDIFDEGVWFVYRIEKSHDGGFGLRLINGDFDGFKGLPETRRAFERVIRKHANDDAMYENDEARFVPVPEEDLSLFSDFVAELVEFD